MYFTLGTLPKFFPLNNMYLTTLDYFFIRNKNFSLLSLGNFSSKT